MGEIRYIISHMVLFWWYCIAYGIYVLVILYLLICFEMVVEILPCRIQAPAHCTKGGDWNKANLSLTHAISVIRS